MSKSKHEKLSPHQYSSKLRKIDDHVQLMEIWAIAWRDQELARLFVESGWSTAEIAQTVDMEEPVVARQVLFGRFLRSMSNGRSSSIFKNLTEHRFHELWERSDDKAAEKKRFEDILVCFEEIVPKSNGRQSSDIAKRIIKHFADGQWHDICLIAPAVDASVDEVVKRLKNMEKRRTYGVFCESRKAGKSVKFRIVKGGGKKMDIDTLRGEVSPIISQLESEGKKNMATMSPLTVLNLSNELKKTLDKLAK